MLFQRFVSYNREELCFTCRIWACFSKFLGSVHLNFDKIKDWAQFTNEPKMVNAVFAMLLIELGEKGVLMEFCLVRQ